MAAPIYRGGPPFNSAYNRYPNKIVLPLQGAGAPTDGTSGTGLNVAGYGSIYINRSNGQWYLQTGAASSPVWTTIPTGAALSVTSAMLAASAVVSSKISEEVVQVASGTIAVAAVTGVSAGQFGHASGVVLVAPQGTHKVVELISAVMSYDFVTAAYAAGGNITINNAAGGAALTGLVSAANSVGAASDKVIFFYPLTTAGVAAVENGGLNLVSSAAFTQPGTAAGVINWSVQYRVVSTGL